MYSDKGSNDRDKEDKTIYRLDLYPQDLEEEEVNGDPGRLVGFHHRALMVPYLLSFMKQKRM